MKIIYRRGSLCDASERLVVHACSVGGSRRFGESAPLWRRHPHALDIFEWARRAGGLALGEIVWADCGRLLVGNAVMLHGQGRPRDGRCMIDYDALRVAMASIDMRVAAGTCVAMTPIGSEAQGASWRKIAAIVETAATRFRPMVYLPDGIPPAT